MILFKKILKWTGIVLVGLFILAEIIRLPFRLNEEKTVEQVAKIHATKLTLDDVMGKNLPPDPGIEADKTVAGIDANNNGIRDDVELAVFKEYPDSAKTRAVLLQYALALQMEFTQSIVNKDTVTAVAEDGDRAYACVGKIVPRIDLQTYLKEGNQFRSFVEMKQLNTEQRRKAKKDFYNSNLGSYTSPDGACDLDLSTLPN